MDAVGVLGLAAGALTTLSFLPQVLRTWKSKSAKDLSLWMPTVFSLGVLLWIVYGIWIASVPIIVTNCVTLVLACALLIMKMKFG